MPLIGWWRFDGNADDSILSIDGTEHNISWINGKIGQAADMNASGRFIEVPHNSILSSRVFGYATIFSLSAWVYAYEWSNHSLIIGKATGASWSNTTAALWVHSSGVRFVIGSNESGNPSGSSTGPSFAPSLNEWHHVVGVADGVNLLLYVDGELVGTGDIGAVTRERSENTDPITIGRRSVGTTGDYFDGYIDDLRVYDHALSFKEVKHLFRAKTGHWVPEESYVRDKGHWGNHGQNNGATLITDTPIGERAYEFNGIDQSLRLINSIKNKEGTIAFWVYIDPNQSWADAFRLFRTSPGTSAGRVLMYMNGTNRLRVIYYLAATNVNAYFNNANQAITGRWAHIAVTFADGDSPNRGVRIYADGVQVGSGNVAETNTSNSDATVHIDLMREYNSTNSATFCEGKMTDIKIFANALSQPEIMELAQQRASLDNLGSLFTHHISEVGVLESFESGVLDDNWTVHDSNFQIKTNNVYSGVYSAGIETSTNLTDVATWSPPDLRGGRKPDIFSFYWYEVTNSTGGGIRLFDQNDNFVVGFASDNPQWVLNDGDGWTTVWGAGGYQVWIYVEFTFDWNNGTYDYYIKRLSDGETRTGTRSLNTSIGVETIRISEHHSHVWGGHGAFHMWFDNISLRNKDSIRSSYKTPTLSEVGPSNGLIGWWQLNTNANDYSVLNNHGDAKGGAQPIGGSFDFGGGGDWIDLGDSLYLPNNHPFTASGWMLLRTFTTRDMMFSRNSAVKSASPYTWLLGTISGSSMSAYDGSSWRSVSHNFSLNTWFHLTFAFDGTTMHYYVDGNSIGTLSYSFSDSLTGRNTQIGGYSGNTGDFDGKAKDIRFYDRYLTSEEVGILYDITASTGTMMKKTANTLYVRGQFNEVAL